jgi:hypothetical protein
MVRGRRGSRRRNVGGRGVENSVVPVGHYNCLINFKQLSET